MLFFFVVIVVFVVVLGWGVEGGVVFVVGASRTPQGWLVHHWSPPDAHLSPAAPSSCSMHSGHSPVNLFDRRAKSGEGSQWVSNLQ